MRRMFAEHSVRDVRSLDGLWDFVTAAERRDRRRLPARYTRKILVPSCWETLPGLESYRGTGWLRTTVEGEPGKALRLVFDGVSHTATVYVDGKAAGRHYDAYSPWDVVVPPGRKRTRQVVVEVDNTFGEHSCLHHPDDFYTYGGIARPAEAHAVPEVFIDKLLATPVRGRGGKWSLEVRVRLRNWSGRALRRQVTVSAASKQIDLGAVSVRAGGAREVQGKLTGLAVGPWTAETPKLYEVSVELRDGRALVDDLIDRVGFREVRVRGRRLLLNGRPIRLRGYNRHEYHANFGSALPVSMMVHDLELLRDLGCNFIRTSHYPDDMRFLDLCDELGFYVWEESHSKTVNLRHKLFRRQIRAHTREMMEWHHNRPCIIIWGCLNECEDRTPPGLRRHAETLQFMRALDGSRPLTYAQFHGTEAGFDLVDIVSFNVYPAWFWGGFKDIEGEAKRLPRIIRDRRFAGGKGKPVIFSEFGAASIAGYHDRRRTPKWSEEYQARILDEELRVFLNHPGIVGAAIWQFCDVRCTKNAMNPRQMNNKGTVDEFHQPKLVYEVVKRRMHEASRRRG